jgi:hypothetical protein
MEFLYPYTLLEQQVEANIQTYFRKAAAPNLSQIIDYCEII